LRLRVTAAAQSILRAGHPWVFAESVREQNRDGRAGELAVIYDRNDKFLAVGLFDPDSPIRVRILHQRKPETIDAAWWTARLAQAVGRRERLFDEHTNGYRVINGESDGWPGLVLDRYDTTLVLKLYTAAWLPRLEELVELIRAQLSLERIVLRLSRNIQQAAAAQFKINDGAVLVGSPLSGPVIFSETGLRFEADVSRGQKTGFFLDQRENRRLVESLAIGRSVLNAFSFSGGFSLYAARGGADSVTDLDISAHALASAERNFALNKTDAAVAQCKHELIQADTFEWLEKSARRNFDLIILDPPSFAKREAERANAIRACSCSAHVSAEEFFEAVRRAAKDSGREFSEIKTTRHASDHPATFKEAAYLKGIYLRFS
jgi:23S rRNA (cytosine1962-C5)-methyltransferase